MNPATIQPNTEDPPCPSCGVGPDEPCAPLCPEMHRCRECHELPGDNHDGQCFRAAEAAEERSAERNAELVGALRDIAGGAF